MAGDATTTTTGGPLAPGPTPTEMASTFDRFIFPTAAVVLLALILGAAAVVCFVAVPFKQGEPPGLPADVTDEYRVYSFYQRDMYDLYIQSVNKGLAVHALQVGVGMILGLVCVFLGTAMCWFGVTGVVSLDASDGARKLSLQNASVGSALIIGGIILVCFAISRSNQPVDPGGLAETAPRTQAGIAPRARGFGATLGGLNGLPAMSPIEPAPPPMTVRDERRLTEEAEKANRRP